MLRFRLDHIQSHSRGRGGRICFFAEAWKATTCDTPAPFLVANGERKAERQDCRRREDWRAIEAIVRVLKCKTLGIFSATQRCTRQSNKMKSFKFVRMEPRKSNRECGHPIAAQLIGPPLSAQPKMADVPANNINRLYRRKT